MPTITISNGTDADLALLAPLHPRPRRPATVVHILTARAEGSRPVGVLALSMPVLNGPWRDLAWPGVFRTGCKRRDARRLNHATLGVRCISRLIVKPEFRGRGVGTRLVRACLASAPTRHIECITGAPAGEPRTHCFERAGMIRYDLPPSIHRARLIDLLEQHGIDPASPSALELARRVIHPALLARLLKRSTRRAAGCTDEALLRGTLPGTAAFVWSAPNHAQERERETAPCPTLTSARRGSVMRSLRPRPPIPTDCPTR